MHTKAETSWTFSINYLWFVSGRTLYTECGAKRHHQCRFTESLIWVSHITKCREQAMPSVAQSMRHWLVWFLAF